MDNTDSAGKLPRWARPAVYPTRGARIAAILFTGVWLLYLIGAVAYLLVGM